MMTKPANGIPVIIPAIKPPHGKGIYIAYLPYKSGRKPVVGRDYLSAWMGFLGGKDEA